MGISLLWSFWLTAVLFPRAQPGGTEVFDVSSLDLKRLSRSVHRYRSSDEDFKITGTFLMETILNTETIRFRDTHRFICKGEPIEWVFESVHRDDPELSLVAVRFSVEMEPERWCDLGRGSGSIAVRDPNLRKEEQPHAFEAGTVTQSALMRLVTLLPREAGSSWRIDRLAMMGAEPHGPYVLTCLGTDRVLIEDEPAELTWFRLVREGADDHDGTAALSLWVDERGRLVRFGYGPRKMSVWVGEGT